MAMMKLTQKAVNEATCPPGKVKQQFRDTKTKNLFLEVTKSGAATFYYRYKDDKNKQRNHRIGDRSIIKLKDARSAVHKVAGNIAIGMFPETYQEKKLRVAEEDKGELVFSKAFELEYDAHLKAKIKSYHDTRGRFYNHLIPLLGKKKVTNIKQSHVEKALNILKEKKGFKNSTLNRLHADLHSFFQYFVRHEEYPLTVNPMVYMKSYKEEVKEYRELNDEETSRLLSECKKSSNRFLYYIVSLMLYTGARRNEVLNAKFEDFNLEGNQWYIANNKQNKMDIKTISNHVVSIVKEIPNDYGSEFLFPQIENPHKPINNIYHAFNTAKKDAGIIKAFTPHDFRHQFATKLTRQNISIAHIQALLGHSSIRTTLRYARIEHNSLLVATNAMSNSMNDGQKGSSGQGAA